MFDAHYSHTQNVFDLLFDIDYLFDIDNMDGKDELHK